MSTIMAQPKSMTGADGPTDEQPGYKWTEVGLIPEDWRMLPLHACLLRSPSYGINAAAVEFDDSLPTYIRITDIDEDNHFRPAPRVSVKHPNAAAFFLSKGDLVFARTGASVGKSYLYDPNDGPLAFAGFLIRVSPDPAVLEPAFLAYYVQSKRYWNWVATMSVRSGQPGINGQEYGTLQIPLPETKEQCAIANVLSDVDELVTALDKLIAKKRAIKQAAMQQLLTGKTRLPGFAKKWSYKRTEMGMIPEDWDCDYLGDLTARIGSGITPTGGERVYTKEGRPFLRSQNVGWGNLQLDDLAFITDEIHASFSASEIEEGDLLLNITGASIGRCAVADARIAGGNVNQHVCEIRTDWQKLDPRYLNSYLLSASGQKQVDSFQAGGNRQGLNYNQIRSFLVPRPPVPEQRAIATVLSDMDAEIAALEQRLDKTKQVKQGMMQELLTGRTRLV